MTIYTYSNFKKKPNSTKQPTSGTTVTCTLKEATSIENPTFILAGALSSYAGVTSVRWDSRYYFVTDITSQHAGVTEISCTIDRLATFKSDISASYQYIERAGNLNDSQLVDPLRTTLPISSFEAARDSTAPIPSGSETDGYIVLTVASTDVSPMMGGGTSVYFLRARQDSQFPEETVTSVINKLFSVYSGLKNVFADAYHAIIRCTYVPCVAFDTLKNDTATFQNVDMAIGNTAYNDIRPLAYKYPEANPVPFKHRFSKHLVSMGVNVNSKWVDRQPYAKWSIYLPFYGVVEFSPDDYLDFTDASDSKGEVIIDSIFDYATGDLVYIRKKKVVTATATKYYVLDRYQTCIGIDIPLTQSSGGNIIGLLQNGTQALSGLLSQNAVEAIGGIVGGVSSGLQATNSVAGSFSGKGVTTASSECLRDNDDNPLEAYRPLIAIYRNGVTFVTENYSVNLGLPYMRAATISTAGSGYIKTKNASVDLAGTQADKEAVNMMMDEGFYLE